MSVLSIVEWPARVLETKAAPVTTFDEELRSFVADLHDTVDHSGGIGLAANQVGRLDRVLAIKIPWTEPTEQEEPEEKSWWHDKRFTFINPEIVSRAGQVSWREGCLSFPGVYEYVARSAKVTVRAQDESGSEFHVDVDGLMAICLQHEIDHLDGVVFINRMSRLKNKMIRQKLQRRHVFA